jgi:hypothetical protein
MRPVDDMLRTKAFGDQYFDWLLNELFGGVAEERQSTSVGGKNAALSAHHHHGVGSGVEKSAKIPRNKLGVRPCRHRSSASRTLHINPWAVNGFCRNAMFAGSPAY